MSELLSYKTAAGLLLENIPPQRTEVVPLGETLCRVIGCDIEADQDIPAFDRSVMDGYAVRSCDTAKCPSSLQIVGEIPAGKLKNPAIRPKEAVAIMTGAPLPPGADAVVMIEKTERLSSSNVLLHASVRTGENVALKGSEVKSGDIVLKRGQPIGPAQIGVLATFGKTAVEVMAAPRVGILPTGSEVVEIAQSPAAGQIRNSNAPMLAAQSRRLGLVSKEFPVVRDEVAATRLAIQAGLQQVDVLILTGGVSMGRHDYVPQVLKEEGVEIIFHKVAIKPGKPVLFGRLDKQLIFGLPGNPVSSFVTFELFVRPTIRRWMGLENPFLPEVRACIEVPFKNRSGRTFYAPGLAASTGGGAVVSPVTTKGSADLVAFSRANCLVVLPARCGEIEAGKSVKILLLADLIQRGSWDET